MDTPMDTGADTQNASGSGGKCRWHAKNWLITYPQSKLSREEVQNHLSSIKAIEKLVVGQENHQDGNIHFHAFVEYKDKIDSKNVRLWDIKGEHPNVKSVGRGKKNLRNVVKYCTKEDETPLIVGFDLAELENLPGEYGTMIQAIKDGANMMTVRQEYTGSYLRYKRGIKELIAELQQDRQKKLKLKWKPVKSNVPEIAQWLNDHIRRERENPLPQLWISGPPGVGKSSLVTFLMKYLTCFQVPTDKWLCGYQDGEYDLLVIDEFRDKNYPLQKVNKLADGKAHVFETKGGQVNKTDPLPLIVLSNYTLENTYRKVRSEMIGEFTLDRRFHEVYVPAGILISVEEDTEVVE